MPKTRADQLLVELGLAESRTKAQSLIMAGMVYNGDRKVAKSGDQLDDQTLLHIKGNEHPWVSRGGVKLAHAITHFNIGVTGKTAIDVGASTGGFTDVLLTHGARKVYAVDVGHGQLDWKIRNDPRVVVLEKTNARYLTTAEIDEPIELVVCDASFISLMKVLPASMLLAQPGSVLVALIKPQFEVGREQVGKGGVVRDPLLHESVCKEVENWFAEQAEWNVRGVVESPLLGPKGNKEFLIVVEKIHND